MSSSKMSHTLAFLPDSRGTIASRVLVAMRCRIDQAARIVRLASIAARTARAMAACRSRILRRDVDLEPIDRDAIDRRAPQVGRPEIDRERGHDDQRRDVGAPVMPNGQVLRACSRSGNQLRCTAPSWTSLSRDSLSVSVTHS